MKILCYTRQPKEDILYANRLAYSMHLAWKSETGEYVPFHHNEGILYAKAVQDADSGVLRAKSLKSPWIFAAGDDVYGVAAVRTDPDGQTDPESEGSILIFRTSDFVHYDEIGLWKVQEKGFVSEVRCAYDAENKTCLVCWRGEDGIWLEGQGDPFDTDGIPAGTVRKTQEPRVDKEAFPATGSEQQPALQIEGICPGNAIEIPDVKGTYLVRKLMTPVCEKVTLSHRAVCAGRNCCRQGQLRRTVTALWWNAGSTGIRTARGRRGRTAAGCSADAYTRSILRRPLRKIARIRAVCTGTENITISRQTMRTTIRRCISAVQIPWKGSWMPRRC